ncbi:MAG TPA: dTDP-4-dehydrorhamnose 3,5-epimerase [Anaerolineae bacterium]|nr:dTDP-4-dehydrorhamnose 3,5-epimerase [Anaerolineae bacterium]HQK13345.1 dTDP-4-dehydrorhamnose 3,5-epimerase [Anaerolineae bacterium]
MPFTFTRLQIPDVILIEPRVYGDARGFFVETYKHSEFAAAGIPRVFIQHNHSHSAHGVLRGLHYQLHPMAQGKLLSVVAGEIFDVAVDIRRGSPTYGQWVGAALSAANHHLLYVPPGFAHGFCVVSDMADLLYYVTAEYSPSHERGILWNDPALGIAWPIAEPRLSSKDANAPCLRDAENNFIWEGA